MSDLLGTRQKGLAVGLLQVEHVMAPAFDATLTLRLKP